MESDSAFLRRISDLVDDNIDKQTLLRIANEIEANLLAKQSDVGKG